MFKKFPFMLLFLSFWLFLPSSLWAVDYTTGKSRAKDRVRVIGSSDDIDSSIIKEEEEEYLCTREDLRRIKKFDKVARAKIKEYEEIEATVDDVKTREDAIEFSNKMKAVGSFLYSEEFKQMEAVYNRCGMEIPKLKNRELFWVSDEKESDDK